MGHYDGAREADARNDRLELRARLLKIIKQLEKIDSQLSQSDLEELQAVLRLRETIMWLERKCPAKEETA